MTEVLFICFAVLGAFAMTVATLHDSREAVNELYREKDK